MSNNKKNSETTAPQGGQSANLCYTHAQFKKFSKIEKLKYIVGGIITTEESAHIDANGNFIDHVLLKINDLYFCAIDGTSRFKNKEDAISEGKKLQLRWKNKLDSV